MSRCAVGLGLLSLACMSSMAAGQCGPYFSDAVIVGQLPAVPTELQAVDVDRDGVNELIYAARAGANPGVSILKVSAAGVPQVIQTLPQLSADATMKFQVADVNRDGVLDMLVTQASTGSVRVYQGIGGGMFNTSPASFAVGNSPAAFVCAELNNDGKLDLVVANTLEGTYSVLMGNGDGTFQPRVVTSGGIPAFNQLALADMNGDGNLDLILSGGSLRVLVARGNGNGTFAAPTVYSSTTFPGGVPTKLEVSDVNGDSVPDVVCCVNLSDRLMVMFGQSNGTLGTEIGVTVPLNEPMIRTFAMADFNLDGKPDVLLIQGVSGGAAFASIMLNNGNGTFATPVKWNDIIDGGGNALATTTDLNRDGLRDVVFVDRVARLVTMNSTSGGPVRLIFGQSSFVQAEGTNLAFSALAEGAGITYTWYKDGQPVLNTGRVGTYGRIIGIEPLQPSDSGVYQCVIANPCSSITTTSFLYVTPRSDSCDVDFNKDGFITFEDFDAFVQAFEEGC